MLFNSKPYTLDRFVRISITLGLLWGVVWLLGYLSDVLIPFAVAFLLAYLINPLVLFVQKKVANRFAAVFISLFTLVAVAVSLIWLFVPVMMEEIAYMGNILSDLVNNSELAERAKQRLPANLWQLFTEYASRKDVQDFFGTESFWKMAQELARRILPGMWGIITKTASFVMGVVGLSVVGLYLVFLLLDYQKVKETWKSLLPPTYRESATQFVQEFNHAMNKYFRAQALIAVTVGVLFAVGFWLIGLPMGILLGLFIGLLNMVPYLQIIGSIPACLLALFHALETGNSFWMVFGLTAMVFVVVQIIQDAILVPKIMGKVTGLSPAMILLSISVWGKLLGLLGLLIALPVTCLLLAYYRRFLAIAWAKGSSGP